MKILIEILIDLAVVVVVITGVTWTTAGCGEEQVRNREEKVSKCPRWKGSLSNYLVSWFCLKKQQKTKKIQLVVYTSTVITQYNSPIRTRFLPRLLCKLRQIWNQCGKVSANISLFPFAALCLTTTTTATISVKRCKITYWPDACITVLE